MFGQNNKESDPFRSHVTCWDQGHFTQDYIECRLFELCHFGSWSRTVSRHEGLAFMSTFILQAFKPKSNFVKIWGGYQEILSAGAWGRVKIRQEDAPIVQDETATPQCWVTMETATADWSKKGQAFSICVLVNAFWLLELESEVYSTPMCVLQNLGTALSLRTKLHSSGSKLEAKETDDYRENIKLPFYGRQHTRRNGSLI